jgi:hypothetical protein
MTFSEITRMMLSSMDFFELRRMAARYAVPYQGVRRQKLMRDLERKILAKSMGQNPQIVAASEVPAGQTLAARSPVGATSAKPALNERKPLGGTRINTFSARNTFTRI